MRIMAKELSNIDKNMAFDMKTQDGMDWYDVDAKGFEISGLYWRKTGEPLRRLPFDMKVSEELDCLAWNTAGVMLRFRSDTAEIRVSAKLEHYFSGDTMAAVGARGFDLYLGSGNKKNYCKSSRFDPTKDEYIVSLFGPVEIKRMREFTIHFPLYSGLQSVQFGLTEGALIEKPTPWRDPRPVVVYGTSIQQGGCASRPGMCHTNQISRMLNCPFVNLGFSGNGKGEPEMARTMASIQYPAMYVIDYDANAGIDGLKDTLPGFIDILREAHPVTPLLLVSRLPTAGEFGEEPEYPERRLAFTEIHLAELRKRRKAGDHNIHYLDGTTLFGNDPEECTVDGVHATDLGFYMISKRMAPVIERILRRGI